jgi:hypothetical protein
MAKYTSDTNLIKGAATAYKNYDNAAGMYAGLDKVTQAGMGVVDEAVKGYEAEQEKLEKEAKAAKAKQDAIEKSWNDSADQVLLNAGSLGDTLYSSTSDEVQELKKLYLQGVNEKDDKKRLAAMRGLQSHSTWIQDHKQMNQDYAKALKDGKLSNWYKSEAGSEEAHTVDQIMGQKFTKTSRGEDGDVIFHIKDSNGDEKLVPSKEYNNMIMPKNFTITANTEKLQANVNKSEILDEDIVKQSINNSLPNSERDFLAAMYDDVSGKNLKTMLDDRGKNLDQEILNSIDPKAWDADTDGVLDPEEKANFIDAVTNPKNDFFKLETSKQIMADQIFNGVKNRHTNHWGKINAKNNKVNYNELLIKAKYEDYIKNRNNPLANYTNKKVEFELFTKEKGKDVSEKRTVWSDDLISLDNQLSNLMSKSSFDTEDYVDVFGARVGYFPGKGFTSVRKATKNDVSNKEFEKALGRPVKVGEIVRVNPGSDVAYWKTPTDVFRNYSVPTTYNSNKRIIGNDGKVYEKVEGGYKLVN